MEAVRIPRDQRILLLAGPARITRWRWFKVMHLTRWTGQYPDDGVLTPRGLACGCCGHYSATRWRFPLHRYPGDRPVPEDMQAALRGEAPVPRWFTGGRAPGTDPEDLCQSGTGASATLRICPCRRSSGGAGASRGASGARRRLS